jgi:hypothetical protein
MWTVLNYNLDSKLKQDIVNIQNDSNYNLTLMSNRVYGFLPNPNESFWDNKTWLLGAMALFHYFSKPNNISYHNLCRNVKTLPDMASILGMGLQFCTESAECTASPEDQQRYMLLPALRKAPFTLLRGRKQKRT